MLSGQFSEHTKRCGVLSSKVRSFVLKGAEFCPKGAEFCPPAFAETLIK